MARGVSTAWRDDDVHAARASGAGVTRASWRLVIAVLGFCCAALLGTTPAWAEDFPARAVRIVTPFPAGSGPDAMLRVLTGKLARLWGHQVLVENRPGANGFIAIDAAKKAAPDGYTLVQLDNAHLALQPHLYKRLPYDLARDFDAVATLFRTHFFVVVPASSPWRDMRDLVAAARERGGEMAYGSWYVGSPGHMGAALLEARTGVRMTHIPFKDMNQLFIAVGNGDVAWAFGTAASAAAVQRAGKVRFLAAAAPRRIAGHPNVPTVEEAGGPPAFEVKAWVALFAPKGTPPAVLTRLHRDVAQALADAEVRERLAAFTFEPLTVPRAEIDRLIEADARHFGEAVKHLNLSLD